MTEEVKSTLGVMLIQNTLVIGEMYEPTYPGPTADEKDTSAQNNIGGVKTSTVTWIKNDNFKCKIKYTGSTAQNTLIGDIYDRDMDTWTVVFPPGFGPTPGGISFNWSGQILKSLLVEDDGIAYIDLEVTVNGRLSDPVTTWAAGLTTTFWAIKEENANVLTPVPVASAAVYEYDVEAYIDNTTIAITPVFTAGTCYVNGTSVATTVSSAAIPINTGQGAITYISMIVTELNKTPKIYWIRVHVGPTAHP